MDLKRDLFKKGDVNKFEDYYTKRINEHLKAFSSRVTSKVPADIKDHESQYDEGINLPKIKNLKSEFEELLQRRASHIEYSPDHKKQRIAAIYGGMK